MKLLCNGQNVADLRVADSAWSRLRGLLGSDSCETPLQITKTKSVHTLGMRFAIDVAFCDRNLCVLDIVTMPPWRSTRPRWRADSVIEAQAGAFAAWNVKAGDQLEIQP